MTQDALGPVGSDDNPQPFDMTAAWLAFRVAGIASTQGNKTAFVNRYSGNAAMREGRSAEANARFKGWRHAVADEARQAADAGGLSELEAGPVRIELRFTMLRPASHPKRRRTWPIGARSGDIDKLARAVLDAITGVLIVDDAQVVGLDAAKDYAELPGVTVAISRVVADD